MQLVLIVDHQCNLRCSYCYTGAKRSEPMSLETMRKAVALGFALQGARGDLRVSFFGGEPLLHTGLIRSTVEHAEQHAEQLGPEAPQLLFELNTNATLIDDEAIALLAPPRRWAVLSSVYGPQQIHDLYRLDAGGKGSFDKARAGLERLGTAGIHAGLLAVVRPETAAQLGASLTTLLSLEPTRIQLSIDYSASWDEAAVAALRLGLQRAGDIWADCFRAGRTIRVDPLHNKILTHLKGAIPCPTRCQLGGKELAVAPSGRIFPCPQMVGQDEDPTMVIGHVDSGLDHDALQRLQASKERSRRTCEDCALVHRCQCQCGCRHVALSGELGVITEILCETEAAFIDEADRVAELLFSEQCPAFVDYYYRRQWSAAQGAKLTKLRRRPPD